MHLRYGVPPLRFLENRGRLGRRRSHMSVAGFLVLGTPPVGSTFEVDVLSAGGSQNPRRKSGKVNQNCTICVLCRSTESDSIEPKHRKPPYRSAGIRVPSGVRSEGKRDRRLASLSRRPRFRLLSIAEENDF